MTRLQKTNKQLEETIQKFTLEWIRKYIDEDYTVFGIYDYWVDDIGGTLSISDFFISLDNMMDCVRYDMPVDEFYDWYWQWIESDETKPKINIKNWKYKS